MTLKLEDYKDGKQKLCLPRAGTFMRMFRDHRSEWAGVSCWGREKIIFEAAACSKSQHSTNSCNQESDAVFHDHRSGWGWQFREVLAGL